LSKGRSGAVSRSIRTGVSETEEGKEAVGRAQRAFRSNSFEDRDGDGLLGRWERKPMLLTPGKNDIGSQKRVERHRGKQSEHKGSIMGH